jgi:hypothetical protein
MNFRVIEVTKGRHYSYMLKIKVRFVFNFSRSNGRIINNVRAHPLSVM